jgi:adenylate kinase
MLFMPVLFYFIWSVNYSMLNFKLAADRIKRKGRDNMYQLFSNMPLVQRLAQKYKLKSVSPIVFMSTHFIMFIVTHFFAMV